jgi:uncharacterized Zn finger protein
LAGARQDNIYKIEPKSNKRLEYLYEKDIESVWRKRYMAKFMVSKKENRPQDAPPA